MKANWTSHSGRDLLKRVGNIAQIGGTRHYTLDQGFAKGTKAVDVNTGSGLRFTVLPDRAMDISLADFKGVNLAHITCNGEVHPAYYEPEGLGWLRTFPGGLLATCGLTYLGAPCTDGSDRLGLHGRISTSPARQFSDNSRWEDGRYIIELSGIMEEGRIFGDKLRLTRTYRAILGEKKFTISDKIMNFGFQESPFTILYHMNIGYPLLDAGAELHISASKSDTRDKNAAAGTDKMFSFTEPVHAFQEQVFFHTMKATKDGKAHAAIVNKNIGSGLAFFIRTDTQELPHMTQWKMMGEGDYVLGMEPCNIPCMDRAALRKEGILPMLAPGEERKITIEAGILEGMDEIRAFCA